VTRNKVSLAVPMPGFYEDKIKAVSGVSEVSRSQWFGGVYKDPKNFFAQFGVEPDKFFIIRPEMSLPEDAKKAFITERTACIAGRKLADQYHWKVGDRITLQGTIFPMNLELTLRGIYDAPIANDVLYFNWDYLDKSLPLGRQSQVGTFNILADSTDDVPRIADAVDNLFRDSTAQTKTESESAFGLSFVAFLGNVKFFLLSICAAVTFTIVLVSGNTIAMSVRERVREVGVLKTLGYTRGTILGMILGEAVAVCLIGGILGLGLASLLAVVIRNGPSFLAQLQYLTILPPVAALCLVIAALIGLISAFIPALNASRIPIVEALKSDD
jgi:putative ABC transport system permease protein